MKTDNGSNLVGGAIEELSKELKIWQDTSSAYHVEGNKLIENTVGRIKRVLGRRKIEDAMRDINALNLSQPYDGRLLTPNEEMTGRQSLFAGIPATEEKINSKITDYSPHQAYHVAFQKQLHQIFWFVQLQSNLNCL